MTASICESCTAPGICCRKFPLTGERGEFSVWADEDPVAALENAIGAAMPFEPLEVHRSYESDGRRYQTWWWSCPHVSAEGRCGIYDDRPKTCRVFAAGEDALCVMSASNIRSEAGLAIE